MASSRLNGRPIIEVCPLTDEERQAAEDCHWANHDPEVIEEYAGQFVVPYGRKIVAHGYELEAVLAEAARVTGKSPEELPVCGIDDPLLEIPH